MKRTSADRSVHSRVYRAFTLLELLVVMTIIGILAGLLFPALTGANEQAKRLKAKQAAVGITVGMEQFKGDYGVYPNLGTSGADTFVAADNARVMTILRGNETGPTIQNRTKLPYYTYKSAKTGTSRLRDGFDPSGNLLDPWGYQYKLKFDSDYDNRVLAYGEELGTGTVVWSVGKNGVEVVNYTQLSGSDDVVSWR